MRKPAFTLIELIMVIVVLGIVASIGANIIAKLYENYLSSRAVNTMQAQTELVLDQIAKRLQYRIKDSVIARDRDNPNVFVALPNLAPGDEYEIMEWIEKSNESFLGEDNGTTIVPGWSGFIDLDSPDTNGTGNGFIHTRGSRLDFADNIIQALSYGNVGLSGATQRPAIILKGKDDYNISQYGWTGVKGDYTHRVQRVAGRNDVLQFVNNTDTPTTLYEQYDLAWSAYALVPQGTSNDFNLTLSYNYQPWYGERFDQNTTRNILLLENVSTFRFTQIGETIRIKLCVHDNNESGDYDFGFCKERVVF